MTINCIVGEGADAVRNVAKDMCFSNTRGMLPPAMLRTVAGEPLLQFAVLAALLFGIYHSVAPPAADRQIYVSASVRRGIRDDYTLRNGAAPSAAEESGLIERYVDSEVLYREALSLGLDRGDIIVRRRLIQKMEFLAEQAATRREPTEAELTDYLQAHAAQYSVPQRLTFVHVFARSDGDLRQAEQRAQSLLQAIASGSAPQALGDPFLRGREFAAVTTAEIAATFGDAFATSLDDVEVGTWSAPLRSAYGYHLVKISERQARRQAKLDTVREQVQRAWSEEQRDAAAKAEMRRWRERYTVRVDAPESTSTNVQP